MLVRSVPLVLRVCSFTLLLLVAIQATAQTPGVFSYQGRLLSNDPLQTPVDGSIDIEFSIWSGPSSDAGAVQLWSESWSGVELSNGVFSVLLGSNGSPLNSADFQGDSSLFLQLVINGETLSPRQQLGAVPFAIVDEPGNEQQDLVLDGDTLQLSDSAASVDLAPFRDNTDDQQLSLNGDALTLSSDDGDDVVDLSPYRDNTDEQTLSLSGNALTISGSGSSVDLSAAGSDSQTLSLSGNTLGISSGNTVSLVPFLDNTDGQTLNLAGTTLQISGGNSVSLVPFLDNTDNQNIASVLANGTDAGDRDLVNVNNASIDQLTVDNTFTCTDCVDTADIDDDTIGGNDITDNIFILHIDCNGSCADMSMREACDSIEVLRGLTTQAELIGVSCIHGIPSTTGNAFVPCPVQNGTDNECRAFNLRTLADLPCINGDGTDAMVTCLATDIPL